MSKIHRPSLAVPTPKAYVRAALSKIGVSGGAFGKPYTSTPYWSHSLADAVITGLSWPSLFITYTLSTSIVSLARTIISRSYILIDLGTGLHKDIRRKVLRKREREAAAAKKE